MRRFLAVGVLTLAVAAMAFAVPGAWAGSPHFINVTATVSGNSLTVEGKEAGLGNEAQVHIEVTATAECINGGGKHPKAVNKESVSAAGDFPVQNGKANFSLTLTATFKPDCSPPMTVSFSDITVTDTTHGISRSFGSA
jgi:phage tail sheath gpL-like